jgi:predicted molibdopterin-dependent oxidoreductase YjgC
MTKVQTTCPYCGTGCNIDLIVENGRVVKAEGTKNHPVNDGELCLKGMFGWEYIHSPKRLTKPLIRKKDGKYSRDGRLEESSWEEAYALVASKLKETVEKYSSDSVVGFSSARCTNEENYIFQKFIRALGSNNVDHCARF